MKNEKTVNVDGVEVDVEKAQRLIKKVIVKEKKNISTRELGSGAMVDKIKQMIEEEVECY